MNTVVHAWTLSAANQDAPNIYKLLSSPGNRKVEVDGCFGFAHLALSVFGPLINYVHSNELL